MSVSTLTAIPTSIIAGDTVRFTVFPGSYPVADWSLAFILSRRDGSESISTAATVSEGAFLVTLNSATTADISPGDWLYSLRFTEAATGESTTDGTGSLTVLADPSKPADKSWARATLALCEAGISRIAGGSNSQVTINGQSFTKRNLEELMKFRDRLKSIVDAEDRKDDINSGISKSSGIGVRFL